MPVLLADSETLPAYLGPPRRRARRQRETKV